MHAEHRPWTRLGRIGILAGIGLAGMVSIVGSGGGGAVGFPPCGQYCGGGEPLVVSIEPAATTVEIGAAVSFEVVQSSNYDLSYEWRRSADGGVNFVEIDGAVGSSYKLPSVNLADDGAIFMVVARTGGETLTAQALARLSVSATPPRVYQDGEFDLAGWTVLPWIPPGTPAFSPIVEHFASGGNPDAFLKTSLTMPSGIGTVTMLYLSNTAVHHLAVDGAIRSIDYAEDCAALLRGTATTVQATLLIEQNGRRFVSPPPSLPCVSSTWKPVANRNMLRAADFTQLDGPACPVTAACPDFSAAAAPLHLGFARVTRGYAAEASADGIDNWKVSVWRQ